MARTSAWWTLLALLLALMPEPAFAADTDGDGLDDDWELSYFVSVGSQDGSGDADADGLTNEQEESLGTDPTLPDTDGDGLTDAQESANPYKPDPAVADTDGDFLSDGEEVTLGTNPVEPDSDDDGLTDYIEVTKGYNPLAGDSDGGGVWDGEEVLVDKTDPLNPEDDLMDSDNDGLTNYQEDQLGTNPFAADTDGDWLADGEEDADQDGVWEKGDGETDPNDQDSDEDGLDDGWEVLVYSSDPFAPDTDGDGLPDGEEHELKLTQYDCLDPTLADSDKDGLADGDETKAGAVSDPCMADSDLDGLYDISEVFDKTDPLNPGKKATDTDGDGLSDAYEVQVSKTKKDDKDTDGDGLSDAEEAIPLNDGFVTDPLDADTDDDGILDGSEGGKLIEGKLAFGSSPLLWDSDNDGLSDGLEKGLATPEVSAKDPDATAAGKFVADTDPTTTTSVLDADSDDDLLPDGAEDADHDGKKDPSETDPSLYDTDGDGMDDGWETAYSTPAACTQAPLGPLSPNDPADKNKDNDGDGLTNFKEYQLIKWEDGQAVKNATNPCKPDSDGDGLKDGTEVYGKYGPGGPLGKGSDPMQADTDKDGLTDGQEDANHDGVWQPLKETNPIQPDTDGDSLSDGNEVSTTKTDPNNPDTDGDGLSDGTEYNLLGTDPLNPDSDGDKLSDGLEVGAEADVCPQTKTNPHLPDTDNDGLTDGAEDKDADGCFEKEAGETNPLNPDTDGDKLPDGQEVGGKGDEDPGTTTDPLSKDSDQDGLWDSHEDKNKNGGIEPEETDPNDPDTDDGGVMDGTEVYQDGTDPLNPLDDFTADPDGDGLINAVENKLGTDPLDADSDHDFIPDGMEVENPDAPANHDGDAFIDALDSDSDGDGIPDAVEAGDEDLATAAVDSDGDGTADYLDLDSDDDTIPDAVEWSVDADKDGEPDPDADGDGTFNHLDLDSDNEGAGDQVEGTGDEDNDGIMNFVDPVFDEPETLDSDGDGLLNTEEKELGTDPYNPDTDADGLNDKQEVDLHTNPLDADSDDDGLKDGMDGTADADGDLLIAALDPDSDDDGLFDGTEAGMTSPVAETSYENKEGTGYLLAGTDLAAGNFQPDLDPGTTTDWQAADTDGDAADDGAEDPNHNGKKDLGESAPTDPADTVEVKDQDGDGLADAEEYGLGIMVSDGDLDDDGIPDGQEHNWRNDTDRDGLPNFLDADSDNDGLPDGLEEGLTAPVIPAATDLRLRNFVPDLDPAAGTSMVMFDSDRDGSRDGEEDWSHDGQVDEGESDPLDPQSNVGPELADADGDELPDAEEGALGLPPDDADADDDGVLDGHEPNFDVDRDADGLMGALDPDADNDGLPDGCESGLAAPVVGDTDVSRGNFFADLDPASVTRMLVADTDRGGIRDGGEDVDKNGRVDPGESDPNDLADDYDQFVDTDNDGLVDGEETLPGMSPADADADDDGLPDGLEHNWNLDTDGDGKKNVLDPDADGDTLPDGLELCVAEAGPGTDASAGFFVPDADPATCTFMLVPDSDRGGMDDGMEDADRNGRVDAGETDPNDPADDGGGTDDYDGDGLPNDLETEIGTDPWNADSDGDTIPDGMEVGEDHAHPLDTDGDGTIDALDLDSDGDGLPDADEAGDADLATPPVDTDQDGLPDYRDTESDGDGLDDANETAIGTDPHDADSDDDYIPDGVEVGDATDQPRDTDGDKTIDALDDDSDDDTLPDATEAGDTDLATAPADSDDDGLPDYRDQESDGDGLGDADEVNVWDTDPTKKDTDGGGADDFLETQVHHSDPNDPSDDFVGWLEDGGEIQGGVTCGVGTHTSAGAAIALALALLGLLHRRMRGCASALPPTVPSSPCSPGTPPPIGGGRACAGAGPFPVPRKLRLLGPPLPAGRGKGAAMPALAVVCALLLLPRIAAADYHPDAYHASIDGNPFHLSPDGSGIFSVMGDDQAIHLEVHGGVGVQYLDSPLTVVKDGEVVRELIAWRVESQLSFAIGVFHLVEVGFQQPVVLAQDAQYPGQKLGSTSSLGLGNLSLFAKWQLLSSERSLVGAALFLPVYLPTADSSAYMGYDGFGLGPTLVLTTRFSSVLVALNAGYLLQPETSMITFMDGDRYFGGVGLKVDEEDSLVGGGLELTGSTLSAAPFASAREVQAEVDGGLDLHLGDFVVTVGAGKGLEPGYGTPSFRVFSQVRYAYRPNPDRDGDGILNERDDCPDKPEDKDGHKDRDGCPDPDNDGDGILDVKDQCPNDAEDKDGFQDEDGCPDPDNDNDGLPDVKDKCPNDAEDMDQFQDDDGCPDNDNDGDGIPDEKDKCPNDKETFNDYQDEDGCPDKKLAELKTEARKIEILERIHFKFMSAEIQPDSYPLLDQVVQILKDNPHVKLVQVEGHTDKTGPYDLNMQLSLNRAQAVVDYIVGKGIDKQRLKAVGYGYSRRIDYRSGPEANYNNRRVEFNVLEIDLPPGTQVPEEEK